MAESDGKHWRELCAAASEEHDSEKLFSLVNQLLAALDEDENDAKNHGHEELVASLN
jgi:hypothetical protein